MILALPQTLDKFLALKQSKAKLIKLSEDEGKTREVARMALVAC